MSENISAQAENAAQPTLVAPATEVVLPTLDQTPYDQLDNLIAQALNPAAQAPSEPPVAPAAEPSAPETTPQEPQATPPAEEPQTPEGDTPPEPQTPPQSRILPNRISTAQFSPIEQEAIALAKQLKDAGEDVPSFEDRLAIVRARHAETARNQPAPQPAPEALLGEVDSELTAKQAELDEIAKSVGLEDFQAKLREVEGLKNKRSQIEAQKQQLENQQVQKFEKARIASIEAAKSRFPDAADSTTELGREVQSVIDEIRSTPDHPDRAVLQTTNAPTFVAGEAATRLAERRAAEKGTSFATEYAALMAGKPAQASAPQVPAPQRKPVPTAGGAASAPPANAPAPKPLDLSDPATWNPAELEKLLPTRPLNGFTIRH